MKTDMLSTFFDHNIRCNDSLKYLLESIAREQDYELQNQLLRNLIDKYVVLSKELQDKIEEVTFLSVTDPLTKLYNRLKFQEELDREISRSERYGRELSLIMFDIDHFKSVNDTYGHDVGDYVLKRVASVVGHIIRKSDIFARWGGEEFMVICPESAFGNACQLAEKMRKTIEEYVFETVTQLTASFGVARFQTGDDSDILLKAVDKALYKAKNSGRNLVMGC